VVFFFVPGFFDSEADDFLTESDFVRGVPRFQNPRSAWSRSARGEKFSSPESLSVAALKSFVFSHDPALRN
jgi:hypothetical protein